MTGFYYLLIALLNSGTATSSSTTPNPTKIVISVATAGMSAPSTITFRKAVVA